MEASVEPSFIFSDRRRSWAVVLTLLSGTLALLLGDPAAFP